MISAKGNKIRGSSRKHSTDARERFTSAHWGNKPTRTRNFRGYEDVAAATKAKAVTEMGKLTEFEVGDQILTIPPSPVSVLAFTPKTERLLVFSPPEVRKQLATLWVTGAPTYDLAAAHKRVGGRQSEFPFFREPVQVLGEIHSVTYRSNKKGDDLSLYKHDFGDLSEGDGTKPYLAVDKRGRLFVIGGCYTVPDEGITG